MYEYQEDYRVFYKYIPRQVVDRCLVVVIYPSQTSASASSIWPRLRRRRASSIPKYYIFSTGEKIKIFSSSSLITCPWMRQGFVLPDCSNINLPSYVLYYSVSTVGSQNSIIDSNDGDGLNGLKLTFGSCWNGMYQVGLWPNIKTRASIGHPQYSHKPMLILCRTSPGTYLAASNGRAADGAFATSRPASGKEYKVLVGRARHDFVEDPSPPTCSLALGSHDNNIFHDPVSNHDVMVDHYIPNNAFGGPSYLGINYLDSSSGWLVVVV
ncbi:hypothetical protein BD626DRAFT_544128 [Schizophyllum amplum]|uniref:Uncharacterized protein n=1 Tax=Schizophyllum amplum TaxID=97359 RepID=A0A550CX35_9AGAR|nr:hypothetical protein BD626DRAFT_544128 [Auriculariopsis ampla]